MKCCADAQSLIILLISSQILAQIFWLMLIDQCLLTEPGNIAPPFSTEMYISVDLMLYNLSTTLTREALTMQMGHQVYAYANSPSRNLIAVDTEDTGVSERGLVTSSRHRVLTWHQQPYINACCHLRPAEPPRLVTFIDLPYSLTGHILRMTIFLLRQDGLYL